MSASMNRVTLIGNLGNDPELHQTRNGNSVANFSLATSDKWKDKDTGERRERTQWHRVVVFNEGLAKNVAKYLSKGSKVFVEGKLETRKWTDRDGNDRYSTEIVLRPYNGEIGFLDGAKRNDDTADDKDFGTNAENGGNGGGDLDDDIPF